MSPLQHIEVMSEATFSSFDPNLNPTFNPESELEFKPQFGPNLYCGYHKIAGINVAILANQGILDGNAALKGTQFIQMASKQGLTLLFLQNISGFSIGKHAEHNGISKHGA